MATRKNVKAVADREFTEAELLAAAKILAERNKANRENAGKPGLHAVACMPSDAANNVLARCLFNTPGERTLYGVALMIKPGERRLGISASRGLTPGFSVDGGDDGDLSALAVLIAENAPEIESFLAKAYDKAAKNHTFVAKKRKGE